MEILVRGKWGKVFFKKIEKEVVDLKVKGVFFYLVEGALLYHRLDEKGE
jgi:hypothetical protein